MWDTLTVTARVSFERSFKAQFTLIIVCGVFYHNKPFQGDTLFIILADT